ncbi:class F sortase [Nocardioides sp. R-C-SC26]|uniref:class F sortase n=1 Tax=Nocardioides sp. R-C-SC26 TaxID=2870414 RepID=UPI001E531048|nr:class F sortase [Nocardioides sp. R-C-SC26]
MPTAAHIPPSSDRPRRRHVRRALVLRTLAPALLATVALVPLAVGTPQGHASVSPRWEESTPPPLALDLERSARRVAAEECRTVDPNLVRGVCLRYPTRRGTALTWLGSYRAPDGRVFFCIDYLYDSRLRADAREVSTRRLVNQFGDRIGVAEVAALNYLVSTWAGRGSTGSDVDDAAIALIVRQVMSDGVRGDGVVVYPRALKVGDRVREPRGDLDRRVLDRAQKMWREAGRLRGPWRISLIPRDADPMRVGTPRRFAVRVTSAAGRAVTDAGVVVRCTGPVTCHLDSVGTGNRRRDVVVEPRATGRFSLRAAVRAPSAGGVLYRARGWSTHASWTARRAGVQRGWIAQESRAVVEASDEIRVRRARPELTTRASAATTSVGAALADDVTISGLPGARPLLATAELFGPYRQQPGAADCTADKRVGTVRFAVAGDGTYRTPGVVVSEAGYYTWVAALPADLDSLPVRHACGIAEETTLVRRLTPQVGTRASTQRALTGDRIHDTIELAGVSETAVQLRWTLHGPIAPRNGRCAGLSWRGAPIADRGVVLAHGDGLYRTRSTTLVTPGCFTYSVRVPATARTTSARHEPGIAVETALVTRPATPVVPEVPTGPEIAVRPTQRVAPRYLERRYSEEISTPVPGTDAPGDSPSVRGRVRADAGAVSIDRIGLVAPVVSARLDGGVMAIPDDVRTVGWLSVSARPDDVMGASIISGHVSDRRDRRGAFGRLHRAQRGDVVRWRADDGTMRLFDVVSVRRFPRAHGLPASLFRTDGRRLVHLITCADRTVSGGRVHYRDNLVVTAVAR